MLRKEKNLNLGGPLNVNVKFIKCKLLKHKCKLRKNHFQSIQLDAKEDWKKKNRDFLVGSLSFASLCLAALLLFFGRAAPPPRWRWQPFGGSPRISVLIHCARIHARRVLLYGSLTHLIEPPAHKT